MGAVLTEVHEISAALKPLLKKRWLLLGIGNDLRGDDAFGSLLARSLSARGLPAMDAGISPETYTGPIIRYAPDVLILADAAEMGEEPGTLSLLGSEAIAETGASTHDFALSLIVTFLLAQHPMDVVVLAMQPGSRDLGAAPTPALEAALRAAEALFG